MTVNLTAFNQPYHLKTAVLFLVFNRLDTTKQVFEEIRQARPPRLYIAADGARASREGEVATVQAIRDYVKIHIDWECEVRTLYREHNLGCKLAVSSAITWFFEHEEMGIILEDDCLPHPTFFKFCEELLNYYRDDTRIGMISGDNFQFGQSRTDASYYFSRINHIWGWASWRRAWQYYDREASIWPLFQDGDWLDVIACNQSEKRYWNNIFKLVHAGRIDTWDYQWVLASWTQGMLSVMPNVNLISNIGFGPGATHTFGSNVYANMKVEQMDFPLLHARIILPNLSADAYTAKSQFTTKSLFSRILHKLSLIIRS